MAVLSDDIGGITAYAAAVNRGYTGTKEEFEQLMYSYTEVAERAEAAAGNAHESEEASIEAKDIAVSAKNEAVSARDASQSARDASISAKNDSESARDSAISAKNDTLAAKDAVMDAKSSVDETSANFSDEVTAAISDVNAAGRNQKELAKTHAVDSEAWAVGQREGADVGVSDETYHNNSKYYAEQSELARDASVSAKNAAESAKADAISAKNQAETAKGDAQDIVDGINAKSEQIDQNAEDISDLQTAISTKAEIDGNYENLTAGTAEQLASTVFIEDNAPYIIRKSIADGSDRLYDQIVGGTVCFNQLVRNGNFADISNWSGSAATISASENVLTVTKSENTGDGVGYARQVDLSFTVGHKYIMSISYKGITGKQLTLFSNSANAGMTQIIPADSDWHTVTKIVNVTATPSVPGILWLNYATTTADNVAQFKDYNIFDLTQMFGTTIADYVYGLETATAGAGVEWLKAHFPRIFNAGYIPYNAGELVSVQASAHKMTGFNQWDEEWEQGYISNTGELQNNAYYFRSKNYIPIFPETTYFYKCPADYSDYARFAFYDADNRFLSYVGTSSYIDWTFTTPANAHYMKFTTGEKLNKSGVSYRGDICINLSDPAKNGTYEPYEEHSYPLDDSLELRGLPKLDADNNLVYDGDVYESTGKVTRKYGIVDLGTLDWSLRTDVGQWVFSTTDGAINYVYRADVGMICPTYQYIGTVVAATSMNNFDKAIGSYYSPNGTAHVVYIKDSSYTNAASFKAAMSGVMLVYELATPTTEQAQSFTNPQIVDDFGTEEYVTDSIVPVGHVTKYANNLRAKLEMAPNSPDGDGDYIVRQTSGLNEYVSLSSSEVIQNINEAISDNAEQIETKADITDLLKAFPTDTASGSVASFADGANVPVKSLIVNIDPVQSGSGDPSPDNVRPISGWSEVNVQRAGKNLFPYNDVESQTKNGVTFTVEKSNGVITNIHMQGTATTAFSFAFYISADDEPWVLPKGDFKLYIGGDKPASSQIFDINVRKFGTTLDISASTGEATITLSEQTAFGSAYIWVYSGAVLDHNIIPVIVQSGVDTSVKYPVTQRQSITISLGQTVYGGKLDVVSGELVIDRAMADLGTKNWSYNGSQNHYFATDISEIVKTTTTTQVANLVCSNYKTVAQSEWTTNKPCISQISNSNSILISDDTYTDTATFKSAMSGVQLVYPIATPITIQLTPHEVRSLLGSNNVWADTGDTEVTYRADPTLYIQRKIAEALANTSEG